MADQTVLVGRITTYFETDVYWDEETSVLRHGKSGSRPQNLLLVSVDGLAVLVHCQADHDPRLLHVPHEKDSREFTSAGSPPPAKEATCFATTGDVVFRESGFGLLADKIFLCAEADGRITLSRSACNAWELFRLEPVDRVDSKVFDVSMAALPRDHFDEPGFPFDFYREGAVDFDERGVPFVLGGMKIDIAPKPAPTRDRLTVVIRDPSYIAHYFHFSEILFALFAIHMERFPQLEIGQLIFGTQKWRGNPLNNVQQQLVDALYGNVDVIETADVSLKTVLKKNILVIDRARAPSRINKFLEAFQDDVRRWMPEIRRRVFAYAGVSERSKLGPAGICCAYSVRQPTRTLTGPIKRQLFDMIRDTAGAVTEVNFGGMTWLEQVKYVADVDLLIGIHGNGLTNLLWLPQHAVVIEIFPSDTHLYDYQVMAEIAGLTYFGIEASEPGRVYREWNRLFSKWNGPSGGMVINKPVDYLPRDSMRRILSLATDRLARQV